MAAKILLVDDDPDFNTMLCDVLEFDGHTVDATNGAEQARQKLVGNDYQLIITDYKMPGTNGGEFARQCLKEYPGVQIIMVSGYMEESEMSRLKADGIAEILLKPFDIFVMINCVKGLLAEA